MNIKETQDRNYELLCLIDDICRKEGVRYFLDGGTEIGAVREKDLIPWDDDIDIKILRTEYPKFKAAMEKNLPPEIRLVEPAEFAPLFYDLVTRVVDTRYLLRKETEADRAYGNYQNYVCVDVFEHFHMPGNRLARMAARTKLKLVYGLGMGHRHRQEYRKYNPAQKIAVAVMSLAGKLVSPKAVCDWFEREMDRLDRKHADSPWLFSSWVPGPVFQRAEWYRSAAEGEIRGRKFPIPVGYDEDLRTLYGDYMKPPADRDAFIQHLDPEDRYRE